MEIFPKPPIVIVCVAGPLGLEKLGAEIRPHVMRVPTN